MAKKGCHYKGASAGLYKKAAGCPALGDTKCPVLAQGKNCSFIAQLAKCPITAKAKGCPFLAKECPFPKGRSGCTYKKVNTTAFKL